VTEWTAFTPDGRRITLTNGKDGWRAVCGDHESGPRPRPELAVVEAIMLHDSDSVILHAMGFEYAAWARDLAEKIESN
jgi:hypothetical protein